MLVLSRRIDEEILLPGVGVKVKVIRVKGNQVRLGIEAPEDVRIVRGEIAFERDVTVGEPEIEHTDFQNLPLPAASLPKSSLSAWRAAS